MKNCCLIKNYNINKCLRNDGKIFNLPRKFTIKECKYKKQKGFSMKSSCAPFKFCKNVKTKKKTFLFNPNNPKKSFDVYIDKNPKDTINIKYKTIEDVKNTIKNLEKLYKKKIYSHKRIWQVAMILNTRLKTIYKYRNTLYKKSKNITNRFKLANKYFKFLKTRTKTNKLIN
jgi:hypothetical protein